VTVVKFKRGGAIYVSRREDIIPFIRIIERWLDTHGFPPPYDAEPGEART